MKDVRIRVVIAEDHLLFRQGLKELLSHYKNIELVGEGGNGKELLAVLKKTGCDTVLLDCRMPVMDGRKTLAHLQLKHPHIAVIMLSAFNDREDVEYFISRGAKGFLTKNTSID